MIGTNYDPTGHSVGFWIAFLSIAVTGTIALMALFMYAVARASQATAPAAPETPETPVSPTTLETPEQASPTPARPPHGGGVAPAA